MSRPTPLLSPLSRLAFATMATVALGAGCAPDKPVTPAVPTPSPAAAPATSDAMAPNGLMPQDGDAPVDTDFTAGSEYMRETPERYADLNGKKPYLLYFYADWSQADRAQHPELVKLFDAKKLGTVMLRVNFKDNQVTDEGVAWANTLRVDKEQTFIAFDASGKEVGRHTGPIDETKLHDLMVKAGGR